MIGKPEPTVPPLCTLPEVQVLEFSGRDASTFLHAQTMNDVRALEDDHWQWNGCLSAKGRLLALFALLRLEQDRYWAVLPDGGADALAGHLSRYVFRAKVALQVRPLAAYGLAHASAFDTAPARGVQPGSGSRLGADGHGALALDFSGTATTRQLLLRACASTAAAAAAPAPDVDADADVDADSAAVSAACSAATCDTGAESGIGHGDPTQRAGQLHWRRCDLMHGLPRLAPAQRDAFTPQMLSLERLGAFSLTKGCYPGQEIVARTHYLGKARRALLLLHVHGTPQAGATVAAGGSAVGQVVSVADATANADALALAVASAPPASDDWTADGLAASELPLLEGLAR